MSKGVRGVILDMDGTLVDSNEAHARTWVETLKSFGYDVTLEVVRPLIGQGSDKLLPRLAGINKDSAIGQKMVAHRSALFEQQFLSSIQPFPGSRDLVKRMHDAGLKIVIASSSRSNHLKHFIETLGIGTLIDGSTSASDVDVSKPDPDVVAAALDKLGIEKPAWQASWRHCVISMSLHQGLARLFQPGSSQRDFQVTGIRD